jgi:sulfur-oxidizing protein SoxY
MTSRRHFIVAAGGLLAGAHAAFVAHPARATPDAMREAIRKLTGAAAPRRGRVKLDLPPLIDNGNAVLLSVSVDSPMTPADHVKAIHVFAEKNPQPYVVSAYLGPRCGRASISTRIRVADTQTLIAIAEMSDGSLWSDSVDVVVTLAACLDELP